MWGGYSLSRSIKLTKTIVLSFVGLALVTAGLSIVGITAAAKKGETQPQSANTLTLANASNNSSVNKVALIKAGTGLDGEGGSNNTVLINNSAKWRVALNLSVGTTTVTMEFPNGNVIDGASISSAAGCVDGSKLEKINGSYTNNKATCVIKADSPKSQNWDITDYVFGGNGQKLAPTKVTINGQDYAGTIPSVTLKGKANYSVEIHSDVDDNSKNGRRNIRFNYSLTAPLGDNGAIGLEPLKDGSITIPIDTSALPSGWTVAWCNTTASSYRLSASGEGKNSVLNAGVLKCTKISDTQLILSIKNVAVGYKHYPTITVYGTALQVIYYSIGAVQLSVPLDSVPDSGKTYSIKSGNFSAVTTSGSETTIAAADAVSWWIHKNAEGFISTFAYGTGFHAPWDGGQPIYPSESFTVVYDVYSNENPMSDRSTNVYTCGTWNPRDLQITAPLKYDAGSINQNRFLGNTIGVEYGVIGTDMNVLADAAAPCGKYGDGNSAFYKTLDEAKKYASSKGLSVNAIRLYVAAMQSGVRDNIFGSIGMRSTDNLSHNPQLRMRVVSDQWTTSQTMTHLYVPGIVRTTVATTNNTASSPANIPNGTQHVTITPYTYARDNNVKATVTLPKGLAPVSGSYKFGNDAIVPNITNNSDGTKTLTFSLGSLGQSGKENLAAQTIEFDTNIDPTISAPQSLTINVVMTGDGTSKAVASWRQATTTFSVAQVTGAYGYNMSQSSADLLPGDTQTYNYTTYNNPDDPNANPSMKTISVLPYNGDNRGTTNVAYTPDKLTLNTIKDSSGVETDTNNLKLFYTTDQSIRENTRETDATVNWTEIPVSSAKVVTLAGTINPDGTTATEGKGYDLPKDVTAIKWVDTSTTKGRLVSVSLTLRNISSTGDNAKLASNIALVKVSNGSNTADQYELQNQETKIATVEPTTVSLAIDSQSLNLSHQVTADGADFAKTTSVLTTKTNNAYGYNLTMQAVKSNSLVNQTSNSHQINSIAIGGGQAVATLASGTWGYALPGNTAQGFGDVNSYSTLTKTSKFKSIPGSTAAALNATRTRPNQITGDQTSVLYGANLTGRASGVYKADIVYTAVANPFK